MALGVVCNYYLGMLNAVVSIISCIDLWHKVCNILKFNNNHFINAINTDLL